MVDGTRRRAAVLIVALCGFLSGTHAQAHGIWGHIHVTGWAIDHLPEGELRQFFSDPEVFNAALFGAAFADSGYAESGASRECRPRVRRTYALGAFRGGLHRLDAGP